MFSLHTPIMLWGLAGLSLPIIAHLLRRGVAERFDFPAVWLLEQSSQDAAAGMRLWRYVLLFLRTLAIVLLVLAFARPQTTNPEGLNTQHSVAGQQAQTQSRADGDLTLILLDASRSMGQQLRGAGGDVWSQALVAGQRVITQLQAGKDRCQIWRLDGSIVPLLPKPTANLKAAQAALMAQPLPGAGGFDWQDAIDRAMDTLEARGGGRLVVITDRRLTIQATSKHPMDVRTVSLAEQGADNLAIVSVEVIEDEAISRVPIAGASGVVRAGLRWFGESNQMPRQATVELLIDGESVAVAQAALLADGETLVDLPVTWLAEGWRRLEARILSIDGRVEDSTRDALVADNQRRAGVYVREPVLVTVVPVADSLNTADAWVAALALSPHQDGRDRLRAQVIQADEPPSASDVYNADLRLSAVVVRVGGRDLPRAWRDWVSAGGRLIWWPGPGPRGPRKGLGAGSGIAATQDMDSPLIAGFTEQAVSSMADELNATGAVVGGLVGQVGLGDVFKDASRSHVWLRDTAGQPLVIHETWGDRGRLVRFDLSFAAVSRTGWLVPLMQQVAYELLPEVERPVESPVNQTMGLTGMDTSVIADDIGNVQLNLRGPRGELLPARSGRTGSGVWYAGFMPTQEGLYQLMRGDRTLAAAVATASAEESDLMGQHKLLAIRWASRDAGARAAAQVSESKNVTLEGLTQPGVVAWWPLCLAAAGLVMLIELLLSGKAVAG